MNDTIIEVVKLERIKCGGCGLVYAVDQDWVDARQASGDGFKCPNGCCRVFREKDADRIKREMQAQLEAERRRREMAERIATHESQLRQIAERRRATAQGQITKLKKRLGNGTCPCCNRTFQQLAKHMACKHPEYSGDTQ